jgi:lipid-binding SYLF domain-containing protein
MNIRRTILIILVLGLFTGPSAALAEDRSLDSIVSESEQLFRQFMQDNTKTIPREILQKAEAIAIYPTVIHGGFLVGARYGKGILLIHDKANHKWEKWNFTTMKGLSAGAQLGIQALDVVLVIMNERGLQGFEDRRFELGVDATVLAGPLGEHLEASTDFWQGADVLSYIAKRGFFGGISLGGVILTPHHDDTKKFTDSKGSLTSLQNTLTELTYSKN